MVSTTGEDSAWFVLDDELVPRPAEMPARGAPRRRAHRRELRAFALLGALRRRRRRVAARRRHREPGRADALDQVAARQRHLRRRAGLRLAGRRHHGDGRRREDAGQQLRLGADAGDRLADRVHDAARRLPRPRRPHGPRAQPRRRARRRRLARRRCRAGRAVAAAARRSERGDEHADAQRRDCDAGSTPVAGISSTGRSTASSPPTAMPAPSARAIERAWARFAHACSTSSSPSCRCCAPTSRAPEARRSRRAAPSRGGCSLRAAPHADDGRFVTAMAAVAGSVAEELIAAFDDARIARASINNGGDIALVLARARRYEVGVCADPVRGRSAPPHRRPLRGRRRVAGARHRHFGLARPQLLARHRRQRHRARGDCVGRRRRGDDRRQRGRRRRCAHRPRAGDARCATTATSAIASSRAHVPPLPERAGRDRARARRRRGAGADRAPGASSRRCSRCRAAGARRRGAAALPPDRCRRCAGELASGSLRSRKDRHAVPRHRRAARGRTCASSSARRGRLARQRPAPARPLQRGSVAAVVKNPYAGALRRGHPADDGSAQAARPRRWRRAWSMRSAVPSADRGLRQGRADRPGRRARARRALARAGRLRHARPARRLARDRAVDDQDRRRRQRRSTCRSTTASPPTCAAISTTLEVRVADSPRPNEMLLVIAMTTGRAAARARRRPAGRRDCEVRRAALGSTERPERRRRHGRCMERPVSTTRRSP